MPGESTTAPGGPGAWLAMARREKEREGGGEKNRGGRFSHDTKNNTVELQQHRAISREKFTKSRFAFFLHRKCKLESWQAERSFLKQGLLLTMSSYVMKGDARPQNYISIFFWSGTSCTLTMIEDATTKPLGEVTV